MHKRDSMKIASLILFNVFGWFVLRFGKFKTFTSTENKAPYDFDSTPWQIHSNNLTLYRLNFFHSFSGHNLR